MNYICYFEFCALTYNLLPCNIEVEGNYMNVEIRMQNVVLGHIKYCITFDSIMS